MKTIIATMLAASTLYGAYTSAQASQAIQDNPLPYTQPYEFKGVQVYGDRLNELHAWDVVAYPHPQKDNTLVVAAGWHNPLDRPVMIGGIVPALEGYIATGAIARTLEPHSAAITEVEITLKQPLSVGDSLPLQFLRVGQPSINTSVDIVGTDTGQKWVGDKLKPENATPLGCGGFR